MSEVTIEMYRGFDPLLGDILLGLNVCKDIVCSSYYLGDLDIWLKPEGFLSPSMWEYNPSRFFGGTESIRKMEHIWTHTFTVED